jgi:hypothetical protein
VSLAATRSNHTPEVGFTAPAGVAVAEAISAAYGRGREPWLIFVIVSGLVIGFAGLVTHSMPAMSVGFLLSMGGLLLAANAL